MINLRYYKIVIYFSSSLFIKILYDFRTIDYGNNKNKKTTINFVHIFLNILYSLSNINLKPLVTKLAIAISTACSIAGYGY